MNKNKRLLRHLILVMILIIGLAFCLVPTHYYVEGVGSAENTSQFVKVGGQRDRHQGHFMLTTVGIQGPVTGLQLLLSKAQPFTEIISHDELMGDDDTAAYDQIQKYYMESSINAAIEAAYQKAHQAYHTKYLGVYVMSILEQSTFKKDLSIGDTITAIDQHQFKSANKFVKYVQGLKVNQPVTISYEHRGHHQTATHRLIKLPKSRYAGLGITLTDHSKVVTKIPVKINAGEIGGPSAGLMFTLQVYNQLTQRNLTSGRKIAGTGTMDSGGNVGPIGGIDKKVLIASREGAKVFFAPDDPVTKAILKVEPHYQNNYAIAKAAAKKIGTKMKIVPVKTLDDALNYLMTN
ncbi:SepM family pheromone-processing serine protease [Latilactobacillus graminis]|uniref:endopeptidase La n=2 Tax=Latilactobacillus graminis TaxID=60519 RepID=A0AA89KXX9_9LACO|nr:SepM family pheromone-processing serine protease [Latilactobacillus graminis]KRM23839.1 lipoprotein precursor [Latilactobacillus graminis DSM 20719]QFP79729.1 PDZ domain-containing protein [Latilactobacillus graminis]